MRAVKVIDQAVLPPVTSQSLFGVTYFLDRDEKLCVSRTNSIADHPPLLVEFHPSCAAYLADPFAYTRALFRLDALAIGQNLIDVFRLVILLEFKRRITAHRVAAACRNQKTDRRQGYCSEHRFHLKPPSRHAYR